MADNAEQLRALGRAWGQPVSDPGSGPPNSWWKLDPYSAMGWLFIAAGIGVGAGGLIGVFIGCGIGLIVFGNTAFGWLYGQPQKKLRKGQRDVHASQAETPLSRSGLPQDTGPWQPQSERVGSGETH